MDIKKTTDNVAMRLNELRQKHCIDKYKELSDEEKKKRLAEGRRVKDGITRKELMELFEQQGLKTNLNSLMIYERDYDSLKEHTDQWIVENEVRGNMGMALKTFCTLCSIYNVSADYMLGMSENRISPNDVNAISDTLGFSKKATRQLLEVAAEKGGANSAVLSDMIDTQEFLDIATNLYDMKLEFSQQAKYCNCADNGDSKTNSINAADRKFTEMMKAVEEILKEDLGYNAFMADTERAEEQSEPETVSAPEQNNRKLKTDYSGNEKINNMDIKEATDYVAMRLKELRNNYYTDGFAEISAEEKAKHLADGRKAGNGLSREECTERLNKLGAKINQQTLTLYELGYDSMKEHTAYIKNMGIIKGNMGMSLYNFCAICEVYNVSADYILGTCEDRIAPNDIKAISDALGFSKGATLKLQKVAAGKGGADSLVLSDMIETQEFLDFAAKLYDIKLAISRQAKYYREADSEETRQHRIEIVNRKLAGIVKEAENILKDGLGYNDLIARTESDNGHQETGTEETAE